MYKRVYEKKNLFFFTEIVRIFAARWRHRVVTKTVAEKNICTKKENFFFPSAGGASIGRYWTLRKLLAAIVQTANSNEYTYKCQLVCGLVQIRLNLQKQQDEWLRNPGNFSELLLACLLAR